MHQSFIQLGHKVGRASGFASLALLAACGGSGSAPGPSAPPAPAGPSLASAALPATYDFTLSDTGSEDDRLTATADFGDSGPVEVTIDSRIEPTLGHYDLTSRVVTFTAGAVAVESDFGAIVVDILGPIALEPGAAPANVGIELTMSLEGFVSLEFGAGTVDLQQASGPVTTLSIDDFEGLLGRRLEVPVWQHQSALAWAALDLLRQLVIVAGDTVAEIGTDLESSISLDRQCEPIPATPPAGTVGQGMLRVTWLGSGDIRGGDDFSADYMDCWRAGPGNRGVLLGGRVDLRGLVGDVEAGVLVRVGFQTVDLLGGVLPDELTIAATRSTSPGVVSQVEPLTFEVANGIRLTFEAP